MVQQTIGIPMGKLHTWRCWNIATNEKEVDYWKNEVITFVVEFFLIFRGCRFHGECQGKKQTFQCQ
jgi:hypothetical protein